MQTFIIWWTEREIPPGRRRLFTPGCSSSAAVTLSCHMFVRLREEKRKEARKLILLIQTHESYTSLNRFFYLFSAVSLSYATMAPGESNLTTWSPSQLCFPAPPGSPESWWNINPMLPVLSWTCSRPTPELHLAPAEWTHAAVVLCFWSRPHVMVGT